MRALWKAIRWTGLFLATILVLLLLPIGYVETFCKSDPKPQAYQAIAKDPEFLRTEANTYLTYPEWHIVYAYEGLGNVLKTGDEHAFGYTKTVLGFWRSFCHLNKKAREHGAADFATRLTVYVIGASFTLEMAAKALYEETLGRLFAALRGDRKSPQDIYAAQMADDYARFLQQTPWYEYDFSTARAKLWDQPIDQAVRGWERRLALGGEWTAKALYAKALVSGVEATTGNAKLRMHVAVSGLSPADLETLPDVKIVAVTPDHVVIDTPRYRAFTRLAQKISTMEGNILEIAGNDDIMLSVIAPRQKTDAAPKRTDIISRLARDGFASDRLLLSVKVANLSDVLRNLDGSDTELEHIYDY